MTRSLFSLLLLVALAARAQPLGTAVALSGPGCRFPDIAWSAKSDRFLVVWADYSVTPARVCGRLVASDGTPQLALPCFSDASANALYPAVAWNEASDEFLVTWDDSGRPLMAGEGIWGQRVKGSDASLLGGNFMISGSGDAIRSGVTSVSSGFAVTYASQLDTFVRFVSSGGSLGVARNVSEDAIFSGYPAITAIDDRVLATWDRDDGTIGGRLLDAESQTVIGPAFAVSRAPGRDRSSSTSDRVLREFWVNFNDQSVAGHSYDQQAQRVAFDGGLIGVPIEVAATGAFEGETLVGTDTAFDSFAGRGISAFQFEEGANVGLAVQELSEAGVPDGTSGLISTGADGVMAIAIDEREHVAAVVWERGSPQSIFLRLVRLRDTRPPRRPRLGLFAINAMAGLAVLGPRELDFKSVTLRIEDGGVLAAESTATAFEVPRNVREVCVVASDGTNDSEPSCVDIPFNEAEPDAGITSPDGGSGGRLMGSGSCGCDSSGSLVMWLWLLVFVRRSPKLGRDVTSGTRTATSP